MAQITIRGMDTAVERKIRHIVKIKGKSINRVILDMIYQSAGLTQQVRKPAAYSLKQLAGGWSEKDAADFEESIKSCEQIDEDMWL